MKQLFFYLIIIVGLIACGDTSILIDSEMTYGIRHDRSLSEYEDLAILTDQDLPSFSSVVCFQYSLDGSDNKDFIATGTLITKDWVLTAGHNFYVEEEQSSPAPVGGIDLLVGSDPNNPTQTIAVEELVFHPTWESDNMDFLKANDLCLVKLATPITDLQPVPYFVNDDELIGSSVWFSGYGDYSQLEGQNPDQLSSRHAMQNILDRKTSGITTQSSNGTVYVGGLLAYDFDHPDGTANTLGDAIVNSDESLLGQGSSDPEALDYEGGTVQGDSGGPLFVRQNNEWKLAGVLSGGAAMPVDGHEDASYGDISVFIRVSTQSDWIDSVIN